MTVFVTFVSVLLAVTYGSVLTLRWFALEFIYNAADEMWGGTLPNIMVASLLLLIAVAIGYFIARPFDRIIKQIQTLRVFAPFSVAFSKRPLIPVRSLNTFSMISEVTLPSDMSLRSSC